MRILLLGGAGMLGHQLWRQLHPSHEVWLTLRKHIAYYAGRDLFDSATTISGIDVSHEDSLQAAFRAARPEVVINCVGIIKQIKDANNPLIALTINSLLPHRLSQLCGIAGSRLIHISSDCVFSGKRGNYTEEDISDAEDFYGRTKFMGEVHEPHCTTIRTSIIGRELETQYGLIEWFLGQQGKTVKGFRRAIYTGFTTLEMARIIDRIIIKRPELSGLWHVTSDPISKYDLLMLAQRAFKWTGRIEPDDTFFCDRSMKSNRFRQHLGYQPPSWSEMLEELAQASR